jgi:hypothetical protein
MRSRVSLRDAYPALEDLFRSKIRVHDPPTDELLVSELVMVVEEWAGRNISSMVKEHIFDMLFEASSLIRLGTASPALSSGWVSQLGKKAIFPVESPSLGLILCRSQDPFYVPETKKYEELFRGQLPLLALDRTLLSHLKPLLESDPFKHDIRYLDSEVICTSVASGTRTLDIAATKKYVNRLTYIQR